MSSCKLLRAKSKQKIPLKKILEDMTIKTIPQDMILFTQSWAGCMRTVSRSKGIHENSMREGRS